MNRKLGFFVSALGLALLVSGCSSDSTAAAQKKTITRTAVEESVFKPTELEATIESLVAAISETEAQDLQLDVVLKNLTGYFQPVVTGANRAMGELEVTGGVIAPQEDDEKVALAKQTEMLTTIREAKTNGIGLAPLGVEQVPEIDAAVKAGIPVVLVDSDQADSKRDLYIGTLNAEAGKTAGGSLKSLLTKTTGTVIILGNDDVGWKDGYDRTMGARDVLAEAGYTVKVLKADWSANGEAVNVAAMTELINAADPPVVGMMGVFSNAFQCAVTAEKLGKAAGEIAISAFDFEPKTVSYMQSGYISVTHAQRQYYMGYLTPYVLYGMITLGKDKTKALLSDQMVDDYRLNSGLDVVPAADLDEYYSFLDSLGVGG